MTLTLADCPIMSGAIPPANNVPAAIGARILKDRFPSGGISKFASTRSVRLMVISGTVPGEALGSLIFTVRICLASQGCPFVLVALVQHNVAASVRKPTTGRARREG